MKRCPTCNRTYADDGFTFCLNDGALLSAPYDPAKEKPVSTIQNSGPPPTAVLPGDSGPVDRRTNENLPPTIASPVKTAASLPLDLRPRPEVETSSTRKPIKPLAIVLLFVIPLVLGGAYLIRRSLLDCPKLVVQCIPSADKAYCYVDVPPRSQALDNGRWKSMALASLRPVLGFQAAPLPVSVSSVSWTTSAGSVSSHTSQASVDIKGLGGRSITVSAVVLSTKWGCSQTVSTSFVVPVEVIAPAK